MEPKPTPEPPKNAWTKSLAIWIGIILALVLFVQAFSGSDTAAAGEEIPYSTFVKRVEAGDVQQVVISPRSDGTSTSLKNSTPIATVSGRFG